MATLDGQFVFGAAVTIVHSPYQNAHQEIAYAGQNGRLSVYMGSRGRTFTVKGLFYGGTAADCIYAEALMRTFADGLGHTLVDNFNRVFTDVVFKGEIQNDPGGPKPGSQGLWYWGYTLVLEGLS